MYLENKRKKTKQEGGKSYKHNELKASNKKQGLKRLLARESNLAVNKIEEKLKLEF